MGRRMTLSECERIHPWLSPGWMMFLRLILLRTPVFQRSMTLRSLHGLWLVMCAHVKHGSEPSMFGDVSKPFAGALSPCLTCNMSMLHTAHHPGFKSRPSQGEKHHGLFNAKINPLFEFDLTMFLLVLEIWSPFCSRPFCRSLLWSKDTTDPVRAIKHWQIGDNIRQSSKHKQFQLYRSKKTNLTLSTQSPWNHHPLYLIKSPLNHHVEAWNHDKLTKTAIKSPSTQHKLPQSHHQINRKKDTIDHFFIQPVVVQNCADMQRYQQP